ncbi:3-methyl-2-oxobutanoate dehydrogenase subunit VorB [Methanobrevibacter filiformis]|uniref:2-oxoglutarate oxidoreductase subunit KorA n=1 Tax=Methanobrevibacter filiformis TaxID=55758 RepID=A0A166BKG3_9EURY|nr:3-methyl-2-oxobutanoate dehydrogenase subunit VorB [Methanobrevibacter filiformis]KZX13483.1 2-oxoglutarate oxidoreductase subunit KorA [Methanobrevibacter filiformis]
MVSQMVKGNTAVIIGALYAGCDCFFGYPITPASEILHEASKYFPMVGRNFVQAESEEAAINMVYGGAAAGHRVMGASSGPGMSLKQEGITFLAGAELPAVIVDVMRGGPGLGNIGPEQGDYNQIVKGGGHGNYKNIVLAPNSVQEMCNLTMKAFDIADKYRNPVIILSDAVLGQMAEPLIFPEKAIEKEIDNSWAVRGNKETMHNLVTSIFQDFDQLEEFNFKLQDKYELIKENEVQYEEYFIEDADIILVSYGISSRLSRTAVDITRKEGLKVGLLRPITLFPFPSERLRELSKKGAKFIAVEMSNGQMREDVQLSIQSEDVKLVNRMGGNLIEMNDILRKIYEISNYHKKLKDTHLQDNEEENIEDPKRYKGFEEEDIQDCKFHSIIN